MIDWLRVDCPYCGESFESAFDTSAGDAELVEDCAVCCRPIVIHVSIDDDGDAAVRVRREND
jgi:hypothetical protein